MTSATTSIKLDTEIKARLQRLAEARRRSQHWLMCEAIEQYVDREERREHSAKTRSRHGRSIRGGHV